MTNFALEIFKSISSNPELNYREIKIDEPSNNVNLVLNNMDNDGTIITINLIDVEKLLNGLLPDGLKKLTIDRSGLVGCSKITIL